MRGMLSPGEDHPLPPGFDDIQRQELSRLYGRLADLRLLFIPIALGIGLYLALAEPARWRAAFLLAAMVPLGAFFAAEAIRFRRAGMSRQAVPVSLLAALLGQTAVAFATGALESPFIYTFVPLAVMIGIFASPGTLQALVAAQSLT